MTGAKHTPGPWRAMEQKDWRHHSVPVMAENGTNKPDKNGRVEPGAALVASCHDSHVTRETAEANARLIAAAPDLLEALQELLADVGAASLVRNPLGIKLRDKARAAIAKARDE